MSTSDPDADYEPKPLDPAFQEKVERLAQKLMRGGDENGIAANDIEAARRVARRMLEDSEARTAQATDLDPDDDDVIRRSSSESAASGDTGPMRTVSDGE
ncbi:MAG: hypothetical protein KY391_01965 [Actinobacteria bacterium]|nr:hypothetical protein [Actinomycetota bacterium]